MVKTSPGTKDSRRLLKDPARRCLGLPKRLSPASNKSKEPNTRKVRQSTAPGTGTLDIRVKWWKDSAHLENECLRHSSQKGRLTGGLIQTQGSGCVFLLKRFAQELIRYEDRLVEGMMY